MNRRFLLIVLVALLGLVPVCFASNSVPVRFHQEYPLVEESFELEREFTYNLLEAYGKFTGELESSLTFSENLVLSTEASQKYVTAGETVQLSIDPINALSVIKISGKLGGSIDWKIMRATDNIQITVKSFNVSHVVSEKIGEHTEIVMDEEIIYSGTIPGFGLQLEIYVRPVLEYTPRIRGTLTSNGPANIQGDLAWFNNELSSLVSFTETAPAEFTLSEPQLILDEFKACMKVYMIVGTLTVGPKDINVVELGNYQINGNDVPLLEMEPNLYELILIMQETSYPDSGHYLELSDDVNVLEARINETLARISEVESDHNHVSRIVERELYPLINELVNVKMNVDQIENDLSNLGSDLTEVNNALNEHTTNTKNEFLDTKTTFSTLYSHDWYLGFGIALTVAIILKVRRELNRNNISYL